jgi:hypothetical protein
VSGRPLVRYCTDLKRIPQRRKYPLPSSGSGAMWKDRHAKIKRRKFLFANSPKNHILNFMKIHHSDEETFTRVQSCHKRTATEKKKKKKSATNFLPSSSREWRGTEGRTDCWRPSERRTERKASCRRPPRRSSGALKTKETVH